MTDFPKLSEGILGEEDIPKTNTELFLALVGQYFPEAIKDGEVDFTALKEEMGEFAEVGAEHYDFTWAGKQAAKKEAMADIFGRSLRYKPQDSLNPDSTENLYIEGDNLEALKLLRRNYHGKIKMIYIDPPYNTGSDFVYRDDFSMTQEELDELSGDTVGGVRFQKNVKNDSKYHTKWLNMIYTRLRLAKELLSDDGAIFISIGEEEIQNISYCCNEIFGETNRVGIVSRVMKTASNNGTFFAPSIDYILCYAKNITCLSRFQDEVDSSLYKKIEKEGIHKGEYYRDDVALYQASLSDLRPNQKFFIDCPDGSKAIPPCSILDETMRQGDGRWRWSKEKYLSSKELLVFKETKSSPLLNEKGERSRYNIYTKSYLSERKESGTLPRNIWLDYINRKGADLLKRMDIPFDFSKPVELIVYIMKIANMNSDYITLDFFSGSATTAHAVMKLNAEDGGHRKFIMVQLPELTDENSEAYKAGYKNICEIGKERIRRAAKKIHEEHPEAQFDDGFKVFEVGETTIRWSKMDDDSLLDIERYSDDKDKIDFTDNYSDTDIVYEIMLRQYGIPLSTPIEKLDSISDRTYIFADSVVVCLEPEITTELIEKLAAIEPTPAKYILRDSAFNDDIELKDVSFRRLSALVQNHQPEAIRKSKYNNFTVEFI